MYRDELGRFLKSNIEVWETGIGFFENLNPREMLYQMGFDPDKYKYVKSWVGTKGKKRKPCFFLAIIKRNEN